jgi:hypothetical protein
VSQIGVPLGLFVGSVDVLGDVTDERWLLANVQSTVVHYKEYEDFDHATFAIAKDMSFFQVELVDLIKKYNPLP